jgi:hypothetical protein
VDTQLIVDHRHRIAAHFAGTGRVIDGGPLLPRVIQKFVVALDMGAGEDLGATIFCQGWGCKEPTNKAESTDDRSAIGLLTQVTRIDCRRLSGIGGFSLDVTA